MTTEFPKIAATPAPTDIVQVLMTEQMARTFEQRCLGRGNTVGDTRLSPPVLFGDSEIPSYIIEVGVE